MNKIVHCVMVSLKSNQGIIMHLEISAEMLLSQLKYTINESSLNQVSLAMKNTNGFDKFAKHLISLNDNLKHMNAYVALSNHTELFKIKSENNTNEALLNEFHETVKKWSNKYHISLETIPNKEVYYILGII
jgi:hypothetical protein